MLPDARRDGVEYCWPLGQKESSGGLSLRISALAQKGHIQSHPVLPIREVQSYHVPM